jgi:hypothetical protein
MSEAEYVALIPRHELQQLDTFLARVAERRGFACSTFHLKQGWDALLEAARQAGWADDFSADDLTDEGLQQLGRMIDEHFFAGRLHAKLGTCKRGCIKYRAVQTNKWDNDWIAFFHTDNVLYFNR